MTIFRLARGVIADRSGISNLDGLRKVPQPNVQKTPPARPNGRFIGENLAAQPVH